MHSLRKWFSRPLAVYLVFLPLLVASYHPLLQLGSASGMHIDLSLLYIAASALAIWKLRYLWVQRKKLLSSTHWLLLFNFSVWASIACLWSPNQTRGVFTAGFMWLMTLLVGIFLVDYPLLKKNHRQVIKVVTVAIGLVVGLAWWQIFAHALGVSSTFTLLPAAYEATVFGVARPTALALEPQFFASLLLAPLLFVLYKLLRGDRKAIYSLYFVVLLTTLALTLSRGGLISFLLGGTVLLATLRPNIRSVAHTALLAAISAALFAATVALAGQLYTGDKRSGYQTLRATVSQLTLGKVSLPPEATPPQPKNVSKKPRSKPRQSYAEESTNSRISMTESGLDLWLQSPLSAVAGVGTGGFGAALASQDSRFPKNTIANNNYVELLAELGLVGFSLFVAFVAWLLIDLVRNKKWLWLASLSALLLQWYFFSGNANVIHLWVLFGLAIGSLSIAARR